MARLFWNHTWGQQFVFVDTPRNFDVAFPTSTYLDAGLGQVDAEGQLFAKEHVRIVRLVERSLELVQLGATECGPVNEEGRTL